MPDVREVTVSIINGQRIAEGSGYRTPRLCIYLLEKPSEFGGVHVASSKDGLEVSWGGRIRNRNLIRNGNKYMISSKVPYAVLGNTEEFKGTPCSVTIRVSFDGGRFLIPMKIIEELYSGFKRGYEFKVEHMLGAQGGSKPNQAELPSSIQEASETLESSQETALEKEHWVRVSILRKGSNGRVRAAVAIQTTDDKDFPGEYLVSRNQSSIIFSKHIKGKVRTRPYFSGRAGCNIHRLEINLAQIWPLEEIPNALKSTTSTWCFINQIGSEFYLDKKVIAGLLSTVTTGDAQNLEEYSSQIEEPTEEVPHLGDAAPSQEEPEGSVQTNLPVPSNLRVPYLIMKVLSEEKNVREANRRAQAQRDELQVELSKVGLGKVNLEEILNSYRGTET